MTTQTDREKALSWIAGFLKRIDTQDSRGTSRPILYLLQQKREYVAHPEYNYTTETVFRHPDMESASCKSLDAAKNWLIDSGFVGKNLEREIDRIEEFQMGHYWETAQAFFTEEGVKRHIELNGHNLKEHRDYVVHCFRNPEMKELFDALRVITSGQPAQGVMVPFDLWKNIRDVLYRRFPRCRDCADENGTCPASGLPCDLDEAIKGIGKDGGK